MDERMARIAFADRAQLRELARGWSASDYQADMRHAAAMAAAYVAVEPIAACRLADMDVPAARHALATMETVRRRYIER